MLTEVLLLYPYSIALQILKVKIMLEERGEAKFCFIFYISV